MSIFDFSGVPKDLQDLQAEFVQLRQNEQERVSRFQAIRRELEASREVDSPAFYSSDYGRKPANDQPLERHHVALPFGQAMTVKHAYGIAGRLPDAHVDRREETLQERYRSDTMERVWWGIIRESGEESIFLDGAWDGSSLGASAYEVIWSMKKQMPLIRPVDPTGTYVIRGVTDPHDFVRAYRAFAVPVVSAQAEYRGKQFRGTDIPVESIDSTHKVGTTPMTIFVYACDRDREVLFALGGNNGTDAKKLVPLWEYDHGLGFVPKVVIPNLGPYRDVWGWSDYEFVRSLLGYLPQLFSREADIIRAVSNGSMYEAGTGIRSETLQRIIRNGGIASGKRDGKVEPIQVPDTPPFEEAHSDRALEYLKMLGFTPDAAWGSGDAGSGSDRGLQLRPGLELSALKQMNWSRGLARLAEYCFRMMEKKQAGPAVYRGARPDVMGRARKAFPPAMLDPAAKPLSVPNPAFETDQSGQEPESVSLPRTPEQLFQGEYRVRFLWKNRLDPDDPAYVTNELNKLQQMAQSYHTTLERLGIENPDDELKLIAQEAETYPWLRPGMLQQQEQELAALAASQNGTGGTNAQGEGGGAPPTANLESALQMMSTKDGTALDADATRAALPKAIGEQFGGA